MASVTRTTIWISGQVLTAAALNNEFNNLLNAMAIVDSDISAGANISTSKINATFPASAMVGINDTQTLINKNINASNNTITNIGTSAISNLAITTALINDAAVTAQKVKRLVGSASLSGNFTYSGTTTSFTDVTGLSVSITINVTSNVRMSILGNVQNSTIGRIVRLQLVRAATNLRIAYIQCQTGGTPSSGDCAALDLSLAAGTYTYKLQIASDGSNNDTVLALIGMQLIVEAESA